MSDLFFSSALLPTGWARDVRLSVGAGGTLVDISSGASSTGADRIAGVAVPGVPNVHSHAFQRALSGLTERGSPRGDTFWTWRERMYGFLEHLTPDDVQAIAAELQVELLRHGYTAVAEFHYLRNAPDGRSYADPVEMGGRILAAAADTGIGVTLLPALYRASDFGGAPPSEGQRRFIAPVEDLLGDIAVLSARTGDDPNVRIGLALHSLRAVGPDDLRDALDAIGRLDATAPVHIHIAEQEREVEACLAWSGRRPVAWLLDHALVDPHWCAIHATHMDEDETRALAATGAVVGLCPTTEANLGDGVFPFTEYLAAGGRWAIGTDSHVGVSPVADLRLLEYVQRLTRRIRNVAAGTRDASTGRVLLEGAWAGGAQASGRPLGRLASGARADVVVLDDEHPTLVGRAEDDLLDAWIFSGEDTPVRHVMVGGRWVVLDGRHVRQDDIGESYRRVARRLGRV